MRKLTKLAQQLYATLKALEEAPGRLPAGYLGSCLPWSYTKVALIELIYALDSLGVIDNKKRRLKDIVRAFEDLFQIDLGNYSDVLMDIRCRKSNPTSFLDELKAALLSRLEAGL